MAKAKMAETKTIEVEPLKVGSVTVWLKGLTPLICNRMANKALRVLLNPDSKPSRKDGLKHDPEDEYRNSMGMRSGKGPTRLLLPAPAVKGALCTAALETKGTSKAQIGRLVWVEGTSLDLYGVPELFMAVVRSADINKTPDVRTRAILPQWCIQATIRFVKPQINETSLFQLLSNGGIIVGLGDFRQEKGKGNYGQFALATKEECAEIVASGGMKQQDEAIKNPKCYDADTEELLGWFKSDVAKRGKNDLLARTA